MSNLYGGRNPRAGKIVKVMTPAMFFGAEGTQPYFESRKDFLAYGEALRPNEATGLRDLLALAKRRVKCDGNLEVTEDAGGNDYVYITFPRGNTSKGCKIRLGGELFRFLTEFFDDQFVIGFDLDELIAETRNEN